jgi:hypothetical protein
VPVDDPGVVANIDTADAFHTAALAWSSRERL